MKYHYLLEADPDKHGWREICHDNPWRSPAHTQYIQASSREQAFEIAERLYPDCWLALTSVSSYLRATGRSLTVRAWLDQLATDDNHGFVATWATTKRVAMVKSWSM
jgi:hypothetical protein